MIQTRDLEAFVAVMAVKSVSLAAGDLNVTQSAVSRRIASLEQHLGQKLFEPRGRGIVPTAFARRLAASASRIHRDLLELETMGRTDRHGPVSLRVAATAQSIETLFAPLLVRLDPGILRLDLTEAGGGEVLSLVMSGAVDAAVTSQPPAGTQVMTHPIATLHMRAYGRPDLLGPGAGPLDIGRLLDAPILCLDESYISRRLLEAAFRLSAATPRIVFEGRSTRAVLALADAGHGIAVLPSNVKTDMTYRQIRTRGDLLTMHQVLVWGHSPHALSGISHLRAQLDTLLQETS